MALHNLWIYVKPGNLEKSFEVVEDLTLMITMTQYPLVVVSFDQDAELLVEKGRVNMIKGGKGSRIAFFHLEDPERQTCVIEENGKTYTVTYKTWNKDVKEGELGFFFEVDVQDAGGDGQGPPA